MRNRIALAGWLLVAGCGGTTPPAPTVEATPPVRAETAPSSGAPAAEAPELEDVHALDSSGWTALQRAAMHGELAEIEALLARGADLEASSPKVYSGATPFEIALEFSQEEAAELLLARGANTASPVGDRALALAARGGFEPLVTQLLARGIPASMRALAMAAKYGYPQVIELLVKYGAPVNMADANDHQFTPLMIAVMEGHAAAAAALIAAGARVNDRDDDGDSILHWAVFASRPGEMHVYEELGQPHETYWIPRTDAPVVELLLKHGANVKATDQEGNTPLHQAAMMDAKVAAELLLAAGAPRNARNRDGKTALDLAKDRQNSVEAVLTARAP